MEIWGDESGNLDFDPASGSRYFVVCTVTTEESSLAADLLTLRRELDLQGFELHEGFHATEDRQAVRDAVFDLLSQRAMRVDATYYRKDKVYQRIRDRPDYFYKWAWFYHLRYVLPRIVPAGTSPFISVASLGVKKKRKLYAEALRDVVNQSLGGARVHCAYWSAASHPCLQAADYYTWAVARHIEGGDRRSYDLIQHQVGTLWSLI